MCAVTSQYLAQYLRVANAISLLTGLLDLTNETLESVIMPEFHIELFDYDCIIIIMFPIYLYLIGGESPSPTDALVCSIVSIIKRSEVIALDLKLIPYV